MTSIHIEPPHPLTDGALCIACNYPLRGLPSTRCPECGREFDPRDPWTMNVGRPMPRLIRALAGPMSVWVRRAVLICCLCILWGSAWLPLGDVAEIVGWILLAVLTGYSTIRRAIRFAVRWRYVQRRMREAPSEHYERLQLLLVFLAVSSTVFSWPLRISLFVQRPLLNHFAWQAYAEKPAGELPKSPRMVGLYYVTNVFVDPGGVCLDLGGDRSLRYRPDGPRSEDYIWFYRQEPWYLGWMNPPRSGKWIASEDTARARLNPWPVINR